MGEGLLHEATARLGPGLVVLNPAGQVQEITNAARRLLGPSAREGAFFRDFFCERHSVTEALRLEAILQKEPRTYSWTTHSHEGSERRVSVAIVPRPAWAGVGPTFICLVEPQSVRRWSCGEDPFLRTILSGVAHEFNNCLTGLLGNMGLALGEVLEGKVDPSDLRASYETAEKASDLAQHLLSFSVQQRFVEQRFDLNDRVRRIEVDLRRCSGRRCRIIMLRSPEPLWIRAAPRLIDQVLFQLSMNALEAMPGGGILRIETFPATPRDSMAEWEAQVKIEDTGEGIAREVRKRIFEPFFTTRSRKEHPGLGLTFTREAVRRSHGRVAVESLPGQGTRVSLFFPLVERKESGKRAGTVPAGGEEHVVLFVDDYPAIRELGESVLRQYGFAVLTAGNGQEAMQRIEADQEHIHLIVLDNHLPDAAGVSLLPRIFESLPEVKVIVTSGYPLEQREKDVLSLGAHAYMQKPFRMSELAEQIMRLLGEYQPGPMG